MSYGNPKPLLLLSFLAIEGRQPRRRLASIFWPFASDPLNRLSVTMSRMNKSLEGVLHVDGAWLSTPVACDVVALRQALARGDLGRVGELYRGRFLDGIAAIGLGEELHEWIQDTGDELARRVQELHLSRAEELAAQGSFDAAAVLVSTALARTDTSTLAPERLCRAHDLLLAGGDPVAARLRADALGLGLAPARSRSEARQRLSQQRSAVRAAGSWRSSAGPTFGRGGELKLLRRLLVDERRRLVTVTGPGGIGKTRLATTAAEELALSRAGAFQGGVVFVDCGGLSRENEIVQALYAGLELPLPPVGPSIPHLAEQMASREPVLALFDAFEHLAGHGRFLTQLLDACPSLSLLLTSTQPLGLRAEWVVGLPGLPDPEESGEPAVLELFVERARHVVPSFELSPSDAKHVAALCRSTGGNPLAIELAAWWVTVMPVADIAQQVANGLDILVSHGCDAGGRHGDIRTVFERSWALLAARERCCLQRLSVFRGGFDREAAAVVAGAELSDLAALCRKSMVAKAPGGRFELPDILRRFVLDILVAAEAEAPAVEERHAAHMLKVVSDASQQVNQAAGGRALDRLDAERANIAAAMAWALRQRRLDLLLGLVEGQSDYWVRRGSLALAAHWYRAVEESTAVDIDPRRFANVLRHHAFVSFTVADFDTPVRLLRRSLTLCRETGDPEGEARTYSLLGILAVYQCDFTTARGRYLEALSVGREHGLEDVVARALNNLGDVHQFLDDLDGARAYYEESLELERRLGNQQMVSNVLGSLGLVALGQGRLADAERSLRESLRLVEALGITFSLSTAFEQYAGLFAMCGRPLRAAELWGAAEALRQRLGTPLEPFAVAGVRKRMAMAQAAARADRFAEHLELGRKMMPAQAAEVALTEGAALADALPLESIRAQRTGTNPLSTGSLAPPS